MVPVRRLGAEGKCVPGVLLHVQKAPHGRAGDVYEQAPNDASPGSDGNFRHWTAWVIIKYSLSTVSTVMIHSRRSGRLVVPCFDHRICANWQLGRIAVLPFVNTRSRRVEVTVGPATPLPTLDVVRLGRQPKRYGSGITMPANPGVLDFGWRKRRSRYLSPNCAPSSPAKWSCPNSSDLRRSSFVTNTASPLSRATRACRIATTRL
jgi:hypothetical protein